MKIIKEVWTIEQLNEDRMSIDPRPQYQRSLVWDQNRKQYLIDSILRGYDIPKIYLKGSRHGDDYRYEVTDGQQRLNAILDFYDDVYSLPRNTRINGTNIGNLNYSALPDDIKEIFGNYELNISYIAESEPWEVNDLFTRLQKGVSLLPVELRHAMMGEIRDAVQKLLTHKFFNHSKIEDRRFKRQDYLDHALASAFYGGDSDLKAPTLYTFYSQLSEDKEVVRELINKASTVLNMMNQINNEYPGIFKNKWGFVDVFGAIYRNLENIDEDNVSVIAERLNDFESARKEYTSTPEELLDSENKTRNKKMLYNYIQAFNREGAFKNSVNKRMTIMEKILFH